MPSLSKAQEKFMAIAAHDPKFAENNHIDQKTAQEWHDADKKVPPEEKKKLPEHKK